MQMILEIPDLVYRRFEQRAESQGRPTEELMIEALDAEVMQRERSGAVITYDGLWGWPVVHSKTPGLLEFGPEGVYEYVDFP